MNARQSIIAIIGITLIIGIAGRYDRAEEILENVSQELQSHISTQIGSTSEPEIAEYYLAHQAKLDSISWINGW